MPGGKHEVTIDSKLTQAGKQMSEGEHVKALGMQVPVSSKHVKAVRRHLFHKAVAEPTCLRTGARVDLLSPTTKLLGTTTAVCS